MDRRHFLQLAAGGLTSALLPLYGCGQQPQQWGTSHWPTPEQPFTPTEAWYFVGIQGIYEADMERYRLKLGGLLERSRSFTLAALRSLPSVTMPITLACVGNSPQGALISSAFFRGVPLADLLRSVGVSGRAKTAIITGMDGFIAFRGVEELMHPDAMLAYDMGPDPEELAPLPTENGFPLRLLTPGTYGYLQPKWIDTLTFTDDSGQHDVLRRSIDYFEGEIQLASGFSRPRNGHQLQPGPREILGYAFGDTRTIEAVEVRIDDEPWQAAELAWNTPDDDLPSMVWCLWRVAWTATPGTHRLSVRAFYGDGEGQRGGRDFPYSGGSVNHIKVHVQEASS